MDFDRWLQTATRFLPPAAYEAVSEELADHYEDTFMGYMQDGLGYEAAQQAALQDLGSPHTTAHALRSVYLPRWRYAVAALASLAPALILIVSLFAAAFGTAATNFRPTYDDIYLQILWRGLLPAVSVISVVSTVYCLNALQALLGVEAVRLRLSIRLICWGMIALLLPMLAFAIATPADAPRLFIINLPFAFYATDAQGALSPLVVGITAGLLVVGAGWAWLGYQVERFREACYGLAVPACLLFFISSGTLVMIALELLAGRAVSGSVWVTLAVINGTVKMGLLTLLFFRAANNNRPALFT